MTLHLWALLKKARPRGPNCPVGREKVLKAEGGAQDYKEIHAPKCWMRAFQIWSKYIFGQGKIYWGSKWGGEGDVSPRRQF